MSQEQKEPALMMRAQFIKDLSFENPDPAAAFNTEEATQPSIGINVQARAQNLGGRNFEVVLEIRIDATRNEKPLFITELSYAGVLTVSDQVEEDKVPQVVMVDGPHLMFPFARQIIADVTRDGGFPPLMLAPMDFAELYRSQHTA
jgi:preprotein translocase subunit SecB